MLFPPLLCKRSVHPQADPSHSATCKSWLLIGWYYYPITSHWHCSWFIHRQIIMNCWRFGFSCRYVLESEKKYLEKLNHHLLPSIMSLFPFITNYQSTTWLTTLTLDTLLLSSLPEPTHQFIYPLAWSPPSPNFLNISIPSFVLQLQSCVTNSLWSVW